MTVWSPRTSFDPRSWLLCDGTVVTEPALEESPSGRKIRLAGTDISAFSKDLDELMIKGVSAAAQARGTKPWMEINLRDPKIPSVSHMGPFPLKPTLHVLNDRRGETVIWWRFRHPTYPIEAVVAVTFESTWNNNYQVVRRFGHPSTVAMQDSVNSNTINNNSFLVEDDNELIRQRNEISDYDLINKFREFVRDNPPTWNESLSLGRQRFNNERTAVSSMLKLCQFMESLATLQVPDLREPESPAWMEFEPYETNLTGEFLASLADYLDGAPSIEEALGHYQEMIRALRAVGMVIEEKTDNDFLRAMTTGDSEGLSVTVTALDTPGAPDQWHTLTVHLPTGTFVVNCSHRKGDRDEVAHAWEESLTMASLTGKDDMLLAYAKEYQRTRNNRRATEIIDERKKSDE